MIINALITSLEFLSIYFISHKLSNKNLRPYIMDFVFLAIILCSDAFIGPQPLFSWLFSQIICILYISQFVAGSKNEGIFLSFATLILISVFQLISALLMIVILPDNITLSDNYSGILGNIIAFAIAVILLYFTKLKNLYNNIILSSFVYKSLLLYSYIILVISLLYFKYNLSKIYDNVFIIIFVILLLMISNACILYYDKETTRKTQELIEYRKNLPIYESLIRDIRTSQHEFSNRLQNLEQLPNTCSTYEELANALQKYTETYSKPLRAYPLLRIDMPLLAAALYNQVLRAEQNGIIVSFDVVTSTIESQATEAELTDYANILLQNAIEACKPEDNIYVQITSSGGKNSIKIRNPIDDRLSINEINKFFEHGYSTKSNEKTDGLSHGLGLHYLRKQLEKSNGYISADCIGHEGNYWISFTIQI